MRNSIAGAWLYSMIMIFMVFMIGYVAVSINYNKTYQVKEDVLNIIEEYQGVNGYSISGIKGVLKKKAFTVSKPCRNVGALKDKSFEGISLENGSKFVRYDKKDTTPYQVCITRDKYESDDDHAVYTDHYYTVFMFFNFDLPLFGRIFNFNVSGQTNVIYYPYDSNDWGPNE